MFDHWLKCQFETATRPNKLPPTGRTYA